MHSKCFWLLPTFIALLGMAHASISTAGCTAQAWVRAPDLAPDSIVRGDVRVKISAECPPVETVILGLRLKERSLMKALRSQEDRSMLKHERIRGGPADIQRISLWDLPRTIYANATFQEMLVNKDLWVVREEERLVFEATQSIDIVGEPSGYHDVVQDFAILVPSTNFPPALDYSNTAFKWGANHEVVDVEFMYEYFIRVPFANGSTKDISAGVTSFQPLYNPAVMLQWPTTHTTPLRQVQFHRDGKDYPAVNYTAQVSGLVFVQGSEDQVATVTITRTGPARTFAAPLKVRGCVQANVSSKWAVEYGMPGSTPLRNDHWHGSVLSSIPNEVKKPDHHLWRSACLGAREATVSITMPNSTLHEIQSGATVTTTSATVTIPIKVDRRQVTTFEAYYQTLANALHITLTTPRAEDESVDPDSPTVEVPTREPKFTDDEEPWVPWEKLELGSQMPRSASWATYIGEVPAVVRPMDEVTSSRRCRGAPTGEDTQSQVVLVHETDCAERSLMHYLDEGARGPLFVDSSAVHELLSEDFSTRILRAPVLAPVVSSPPEGEELVSRYYYQVDRPLIYVGETWVKKVVNRGGHEANFAKMNFGSAGSTH